MHRPRMWYVLPLMTLCHSALVYAATTPAPAGNDLLSNIGTKPVSPPPRAPSPQAPSKKADDQKNPKADQGKGKSMQGVLGLDRVKAVPKKAMLKKQRLELAALTSVSLNDPYYTHLSVSGSAVFYPHDSFGLGAGADFFYLHGKSGRIEEVRLTKTAAEAVYELPRMFIHGDVYWLPLNGKISLFGQGIAHFDMYGSVGAGVATSLHGQYPVAVNLAIGQHYIISQWLALRIEVRDHLFVDTQVAGGFSQSAIQSYFMFNIGASFFVPPTFEYSFQ